MKNLLFSILTFITLNVNGQSPITGCMGIDFKSTRATVKSIMAQKPSFELYKDEPNSESLSYLKGTFAGRTAVGAVFRFYENQLISITVLIEVPQDPQVIDVYFEVIKELQNKYNVEFLNNHKFRYPYQEGDGHETTALKSGNATMESYYADDEAAIAVSITESLSVKVEYQFSDLVQKAIEKKNKTNSKDY